MFALVDCNNFYASCERVFNPSLNGKPVVVLSNNDGCIVARSQEAKDLGIPMAAPAFKMKDIIEKHKVHVFSSNYALYADMSNRVMGILADMSPEIEIYSIDEAFLKFDGCKYMNLQEYGEKMRYKVTKSTGIPVCVGIASTKALTKVANRVAKKFKERTKGVYMIDTEEKRIKALKWLKVEDVWGIGRQHAKRLNNKGVKTAYEFTQLPHQWVKKNMAVVGLRLKKELEGERQLDLEETGKPKKSIATTRSFDKQYTELKDLKERVSTFAVVCAEKLRKQKSNCSSITVFILTNYFKKDQKQYSKSIVVKLPYPTNSSFDIAKFARYGLQLIFKTGYKYKKAGVIVSKISPENEQQLSLFHCPDSRHKPILEAVDKLNKRFGYHKIKLAGESLDRTWKMKQEKLSPRYTTNWDDFITVNSG